MLTLFVDSVLCRQKMWRSRLLYFSLNLGLIWSYVLFESLMCEQLISMSNLSIRTLAVQLPLRSQRTLISPVCSLINPEWFPMVPLWCKHVSHAPIECCMASQTAQWSGLSELTILSVDSWLLSRQVEPSLRLQWHIEPRQSGPLIASHHHESPDSPGRIG